MERLSSKTIHRVRCSATVGSLAILLWSGVPAAAAAVGASPRGKSQSVRAEREDIFDMDIQQLAQVDVVVAGPDFRVAQLSQPESIVGPGGESGTDHEEQEGILDMDIDQLAKTDVVVPSMDIEVTSVTRTESTVGRSAAAIFVVTPEMIRRSGARSIPEVLRMVPGLEVARINSNQWAVTSRGFNSRFADKMLVQIDGRSVYSPLHAGVYWESHHVMLEDIERIEVIRGPGATVWGANAVNGVINVITKSAKDTQGLLIGGGAGSEERGFTKLRYGGTTRNGINWRVYGLQFDRDRGSLPDGEAQDDWRLGQGGFRADWQPTGGDTITFQGDCYEGDAGLEYSEQISSPPYQQDVVEDADLSGANGLMRWSRDLGEHRGWSVQVYYDRFRRRVSLLTDEMDTVDVDFQRELPLGDRHRLIWGARYRHVKSHTEGSFTTSFVPTDRETDLFSYFVQDQITLVPDRLLLTGGSKFEHNDFTSFEFQPTARLLWSPDPRRAVWGAVSRAVRTPSISDDGIRMKMFSVSMGPPPPVFAEIQGDSAVQSEDLMAYEMGYRAQPTDAFSWDLAVFFNRYEDLMVYNPALLGFPPPAIWPWVAVNGMDGETYGGELSATWQLNPCWRVTGSYSYLQMQLHAGAGVDSSVEGQEDRSPHNRIYCRSSWDLAYDLELDLALRYTDSLRVRAGENDVSIPSYVTMDIRLGWRPSESFEIAVVGQNLLDDHHYEFVGVDSVATEVDRGAYGTVTWCY